MDISKVLEKAATQLAIEESTCEARQVIALVQEAIEYIEKQEPVAWLAKDHFGAPIAASTKQREHMKALTSNKDYWADAQPLFTTPPSPKLRELSDEEMENIMCKNRAAYYREPKLFARAILATAREEVK